jgi:hypothetical protein
MPPGVCLAVTATPILLARKKPGLAPNTDQRSSCQDDPHELVDLQNAALIQLNWLPHCTKWRQSAATATL